VLSRRLAEVDALGVITRVHSTTPSYTWSAAEHGKEAGVRQLRLERGIQATQIDLPHPI
jgi:hypothetical protein